MISLHPHPATPCTWLAALEIEWRRSAAGLALVYRLRGDLSRLLLPQPAPARHEDGLWRHTCCEAFVLVGDGPAYREFNFSPSGAWAAYGFTGYRQDMTALASADPGIVCHARPGEFVLHATLADLPPGRLGLSCVIEDTEGGLSCWALAHSGEKPDFHHPATFTLELP